MRRLLAIVVLLVAVALLINHFMSKPEVDDKPAVEQPAAEQPAEQPAA